MLAKLGPERVSFSGAGLGSLVRGFAARHGAERVEVVVYHFDERNQQSTGLAVPVNLTVQGFAGTSQLQATHYRIDLEHSNAAVAWAALGNPSNPTPAQMQVIKSRSELQTLAPPTSLPVVDGRVGLSFMMPVNAVSLIVLEARSDRRSESAEQSATTIYASW
jgi:xylan 1,4-beta-xylosidase